MSDQEMRSADPEWQPQREQQETYNPQPINDDPREQPRWSALPSQQESSYEYSGAYPSPELEWGRAGKLRPKSQKRGRPWLWILPALLIVFWGVQFGMHNRRHDSHDARHNFENVRPNFRDGQPGVFPIASGVHPVIEINDDVGSIHVHVGDVNTVTIRPIIQGAGFEDEPKVEYSRDDGAIHVDVENESDSGGSVDFDVTIPSSADLMLKTDTGSITFDSSLDPSGNYQFQTDAGTISVTLPSDSSFHVNATTDTGSINTAFPELTVQHADGTGAEVDGNVGTSSGATMTLKTETGSITLNKQ